MNATIRCPACGASSTTTDYCDTCGAALSQPAAPTPATTSVTAAPAGAACPHCHTPRSADDVFCEVCGLDFSTGRLPATPPAPGPVAAPDGAEVPPASPAATPAAPAVAPAAPVAGWTAVVEVDPTFFASNQAETPGAVELPQGVAPHEIAITGDEVLIGRRRDSAGVFPMIDLADPAVSHRHAVLRHQPDDTWALVDEGSTNGTWVNDGPEPVAHGALVPLHDGDRLHLGAFTTITLRRS